MITEADARTVLELPDRYVIRHGAHLSTGYHPEEKPVAEDFRYSRDINEDCLEAEGIRAMFPELEAKQAG